jgi:chemotaxis protein methyltransferase CheR
MAAPNAAEIDAFRAAIARRLGLAFDESKSGQLAELLAQRLESTGRSCAEYLAELDQDQPLQRPELATLARALTVGETYFFRNRDHFRACEELVLPDRLRRRGRDRRLQLLSAGCSSGEEAYSLAILARAVVADPHCQVSVRAVDVNPAALEKASRGRFSSWALRETPAELISRWFRADGRELVLDESVRSAVEFEGRNLTLDDAELWRPQHYDLIFCRNVLMYFTPDAARAVVERIARALVPGGYLFLGHAETLRGLSQAFHLCHTHGTFYYQLEHQHEQPRVAASPTPASSLFASSIEALPAPLVDAADGWVDAIRKASERILALSRTDATPRSVPQPRAAQPQPSSGRNELRAAHELLQRERFAEALALVSNLAPEATLDPDVLLLQAVLLAHDGQLSAAEHTCRRLLALDGLNAGAHYVLALCREGAGDRKGAIEEDQVAIYLAPGFAMPRLHLGLLARRQSDRETARRELRQALELLAGEDASRLLLFGGGFQREALVALCRAELAAVGAER